MRHYQEYGENPNPERESAERKEADRVFRKRRKMTQYRTLVNRTIEQRLSLNPFEHADAKRDLLREVMGYNGLTSKGGKNIPLEKCFDIQVGIAFKNTYDTASKRLGFQA